MSLLLQQGTEPIPGYRLVEPLGEGGFGQVWKAEAPGGFHVALKFIRLDQHAEPELRALDAIREIRHPFLLDIHFAQQVGDRLIIATSLCDKSLAKRLKEVRDAGLNGIPTAELLRYMSEIADALDYLNKPHFDSRSGRKVSVQHRDIKPHNIFLVGGSVKVADFGLAKVLEATVAHHTGHLTPAYAPPEVYRGQTSSKSDQYSLAVTYYELRTGQRPFTGNSTEIMHQALFVVPALEGLPAGEKAVVQKALSKEPDERWPDCQTFVANLRVEVEADATDQCPTKAMDSTWRRDAEETRKSAIPTVTPATGRQTSLVPFLTGTAAGLVMVLIVAGLYFLKAPAPTGEVALQSERPQELVSADSNASSPEKAKPVEPVPIEATPLPEPAPAPAPPALPAEKPTAPAPSVLDTPAPPRRVLPAEYVLHVPAGARARVVAGTAVVDASREKPVLQVTQPDGQSPVRLRIEQHGYEPVERTLVAQPGETAPLYFQLTPLPATVLVRTVPVDSRVTLEPSGVAEIARVNDGFQISVARPLQTPEITLRAEHPQYLPQQEQIRIAPGKEQDLTVRLTPKPATIQIALTPKDARLRPLTASGVRYSAQDRILTVERPDGSAISVTAERSGYSATTKDIVVHPGMETTVEVALTPMPAVFRLTVEPQDAQVQINGDLVTARTISEGVREIVQTRPDGKRSVTVAVSRSGFETVRRELVGNPGSREDIDIHLSQQSPSLAISPFTATQARKHQEEWAQHLQRPVHLTDSNQQELVLIPPGRFEMGSREPADQVGRLFNDNPQIHWNEHPLHPVELTKSVYMGVCEVTRGQFARFVEETGYVTDAEKNPGNISRFSYGQEKQSGSRSWNDVQFSQNDDHPAVLVSRNDAVAYCQWLTRKEGVLYRLPTEAEWEFACRAGTTTRYFFGDNPFELQLYANVPDQSLREVNQEILYGIPGDDGFAFTSPAATFRPNPFGLYDMHGNVWEICSDFYSTNYYGNSPLKDPPGPAFGDRYVIRGACWY